MGFGGNPDVVIAEKREDRIDILRELVNFYLLKDILALEKIPNSGTFLILSNY